MFELQFQHPQVIYQFWFQRNKLQLVVWAQFDTAVTFSGFVVHNYIIEGNCRFLIESKLPVITATREEVDSRSRMRNALKV